MPSREHQRAGHALQAVREVEGKSWETNYRSYVDRLGPAVLRNGLGQALAGELAAAGGSGGDGEASDLRSAHRRLYQNIEDWLCGEGRPYSSRPLVDSLIQGGEDEYLEAHAEALAWLEWHKRFCRAYLRRGESAEAVAEPAAESEPEADVGDGASA